MYKNLRTNLPKESMAFVDFAFPAGGRSYLSHQEVLAYLNNYADHFGLKENIKFDTRVTRVQPEQSDSAVTWSMRTQEVKSKREETHTFDAVAVCTGHYFEPSYPEIPGLETFRGTVIHSHDYKMADPFVGRTVVCIGAGPSGIDIAMELAGVARQVFLCHKGFVDFNLPAKVQVMSWPERCDERSVHFEECTVGDVDAIVMCTGYSYDFPFLTEACQVQVIDNRVSPLFKHTIHTKYPSMAFFGLPRAIIPFPLVDIQAQLFRKVLQGEVLLPPTDVMDADTQKELQDVLDGGRRAKDFHKMGPVLMQRYLDDLTDLGNLELPVPSVVHKLYAHLAETRKQSLTTYRDVDYGITGDDFFIRT